MVKVVLTRGSIILALLTGLAVLLGPAQASARKKVSVVRFSGPRGGDAARMINKALKSSYSMVSGGALSRAAKEQGSRSTSTKGRSLGARALRVDAVVGGSVKRVGSRWVLKIDVYSGHNGRRVGGATLPLRGARVDPGTARRMAGKIRGSIGRCRAGGAVARKTASRPRRRPVASTRPRPRPRPAPVMVQPVPVQQPRNDFDDGTDVYQAPVTSPDPLPQPPVAAASDASDEMGGFTTGGQPSNLTSGGSDGLGFDVAAGGGSTSQPATFNDPATGGTSFQGGINRQEPLRPSWETIVEISVGAMLVNRWFTFEGVSIMNPNHKAPPPSSILTSAFHLEGALYPISIFHRGPMANLGISARYYRIFQLQLVNEDTKKQDERGPFNATFSVMEFGLRYRWNILDKASSPTYIVGLDYGRQLFVISDGPDLINLPDITHQYINFALVDLEVPFAATATWSMGMRASFDYLLVYNSGAIENNDSTGYGRSSTGGIEVEGGLFFTYNGFFVRANGFYRRLWYGFAPEECRTQNKNTGCKEAEGALEQLGGGFLRVGYAY